MTRCLSWVSVGLENDVPVMCEKPCASTHTGVRYIAGLSDRTGIPVMVPLTWRREYNIGTREMLTLADSGIIGEVTGFDAVFRACHIGRYVENSRWMVEAEHSGGGCWDNLGIHPLDQGLQLLGGYQGHEAVRCILGPDAAYKGRTYKDIETSADVEVDLPGGKKLRLHVTYDFDTEQNPAPRSFHRELRFTLEGTQGKLAWEPAWQESGNSGFIDNAITVSDADGHTCTSVGFQVPAIGGYQQSGLEFLRAVTAYVRSRGTGNELPVPSPIQEFMPVHALLKEAYRAGGR
ncbi:MAG: hypothetical protein ABH879_02345 [archaeon]